MNKLLSALILAAFAAITLNVQAASHAASAPMTKEDKKEKKEEKKEDKDKKDTAKKPDMKASEPKK